MALGGGVVLEIGYHSGPLILPLIVPGLVASWFYSAPPLRLHTRGVGEITAAGVVSTLVPLIAFTLQGGGLASFPLPVCIPLFLLQMAAILTIQFPDFASDKQTNKQTLVVRLGGKWSARVIVGLIGAAYACLPLLRGAGSSPLVVGAAALSFPLGLWQWSRIIRKEWQQAERWATLGFWGFSLPLGMGLLMAVGYVMGAG
jgi:1,4-dihydroxy-2-naphthoate octaprenyltransferase